MTAIKRFESEYISFEYFASARVPDVFKKKFNVGLLEGIEKNILDFEKSVFIINQCYIAKCKLVNEKIEFSLDDFYDRLLATDAIKVALEIIMDFASEIKLNFPTIEQNPINQEEKKITIE